MMMKVVEGQIASFCLVSVSRLSYVRSQSVNGQRRL